MESDEQRLELEVGFSILVGCGDDDDGDVVFRVCSACRIELKLFWSTSVVDMEADDDDDDDEFCSTFSSNLGIQNRLSVSTNLLLLESILRWRACFCTLVLQ